MGVQLVAWMMVVLGLACAISSMIRVVAERPAWSRRPRLFVRS